jgi:hypothetical protein
VKIKEFFQDERKHNGGEWVIAGLVALFFASLALADHFHLLDHSPPAIIHQTPAQEEACKDRARYCDDVEWDMKGVLALTPKDFKDALTPEDYLPGSKSQKPRAQHLQRAMEESKRCEEYVKAACWMEQLESETQ